MKEGIKLKAKSSRVGNIKGRPVLNSLVGKCATEVSTKQST